MGTNGFNEIVRVNPFHAAGLFLYPLKTSENQSFSDNFRGYKKKPVLRNGYLTLLLGVYFTLQILKRTTFFMKLDTMTR